MIAVQQCPDSVFLQISVSRMRRRDRRYSSGGLGRCGRRFRSDGGLGRCQSGFRGLILGLRLGLVVNYVVLGLGSAERGFLEGLGLSMEGHSVGLAFVSAIARAAITANRNVHNFIVVD